MNTLFRIFITILITTTQINWAAHAMERQDGQHVLLTITKTTKDNDSFNMEINLQRKKASNDPSIPATTITTMNRDTILHTKDSSATHEDALSESLRWVFNTLHVGSKSARNDPIHLVLIDNEIIKLKKTKISDIYYGVLTIQSIIGLIQTNAMLPLNHRDLIQKQQVLPLDRKDQCTKQHIDNANHTPTYYWTKRIVLGSLVIGCGYLLYKYFLSKN